jgi:vanillate O-demethylase ferredoxin subunit
MKVADRHVVRVIRKWREAEGIFGFELVDASGGSLPPFGAGSHIDVAVPGGIVRQYSLSRLFGARGSYEIAVLREPESRGGSATLCDSVKEGETLEISAPRNHFPLESASYTLLLAGGIGITPILCMAEHLAAQGSSFELHYCSRSPGRMAFRERIASSSFASRTFFHFDDGEPSQLLDPLAVFDSPEPGKHLYVCGPSGFLEYIRKAARDAGWRDANVHFEYFSPPADPAPAAAGSFEVQIASSGLTVTVQDESIADALLRVGIDIPVSCEQGVCGSCRMRVIEGEPDHRDYILSDDERTMNDQIFPCCSRSKTPRLVLDF